MFTGIISDIGRILEIAPIPAGLRTRIATAYDPDGIDIGASIFAGSATRNARVDSDTV